MRSDLDGIERQIAALTANRSRIDWKWAVGIILAIFGFCNITITQVRDFTANGLKSAVSYLDEEVAKVYATVEHSAAPSPSPTEKAVHRIHEQ